MRAEPNKFYGACLFVNPYQQKVTFYVTFHTALIFTKKHVWSILCIIYPNQDP